MKKFVLALFIVLAFVSCSKDDEVKVSREEALQIALDNYCSSNTNVHLSNDIVEPSTVLMEDMDWAVSPSYKSWLIVVDMAPMANLGHPFKYVYVKASSGKIEEREVVSGFVPSHIGMEMIKEFDLDAWKEENGQN